MGEYTAKTLMKYVNNYNKALGLYGEIFNLWGDISEKREKADFSEIKKLAKYLEQFKSYIDGYNINAIGNYYNKLDIEEITYNDKIFKETYDYLSLEILRMNYADRLYKNVYDYIEKMNLSDAEIKRYGNSIDEVTKSFIAALTKKDNLRKLKIGGRMRGGEMEGIMKRIINKSIPIRSFSKFFDRIKSEMGRWNDKNNFASLKDYKDNMNKSGIKIRDNDNNLKWPEKPLYFSNDKIPVRGSDPEEWNRKI